MGNNSFLTMPTTVPDYLIESGINPGSSETNRKSKDTSRGSKRTSTSPYSSRKSKK